jgi:RNA ligase
MMATIDIDQLKLHERYISCDVHSSGSLLLWNYNKRCQYDNVWNEYTKTTRGLITKPDGTIVSRPFKKFFNLNASEESKFENLPNEIPNAYEKLDGSLGIQYPFDDNPCITTRGCFTSPMAQWATKWIQSKYKLSDFNPAWTYLHEIIYPENRIVIDYHGRSELALLAVIETETNIEQDYIAEANRLNLAFAREFSFNDINELIEKSKNMPADEEGFVLKFPNGLRVKIKSEEYLRLHRVLSSISNMSVWESLKKTGSIDGVLETIPDEFHPQLKEIETTLREEYRKTKEMAQAGFEECKNLPSRKEQAKLIFSKPCYKDIQGIIFTLIDNYSIRELLWKHIKPQTRIVVTKAEAESDS